MTNYVRSDGSDLENINLEPKTVIEEVLQNVALILATAKFSVPLMRDFGLPMKFIDRPESAAMSVMIGEIYDAVEKYEPRAIIEGIEFEKGDNGKIIAIVGVSVNE